MSVTRLPVVTELKPDDQYDVIFVVMRYTQVGAIMDTLRANGTKNIVFVGNDVRAEEIAAMLPEKNVLFAFALSADTVSVTTLRPSTSGRLPSASFQVRRRTSSLSGRYLTG